MSLLSRDDFRNQCLTRDDGKCVFCGKNADSVHHVIERRLFPDGGYYKDNGISVCEEHHRACEQTVLSPQEARDAAGIKVLILPLQLYADEGPYTKWGDQVLADGRRVPGELFFDESVQKVLREGGMLERYINRFKYPRTFHVPFSPGVGKDDRVLPDLSSFVGRRIIASEKEDGENSQIYADGFMHARSIDGLAHPSQSRIRALGAGIGPQLPLGWRLAMENLTAVHSIAYKAAPAHAVLLSIWNERNICLAFDETVEWAGLLGLTTPPVLYDGLFDEAILRGLWHETNAVGDPMEGWVMRLADAFEYRAFSRSMAKFVRAGHVAIHARHWRRGPIVENQIAPPKELA